VTRNNGFSFCCQMGKKSSLYQASSIKRQALESPQEISKGTEAGRGEWVGWVVLLLWMEAAAAPLAGWLVAGRRLSETQREEEVREEESRSVASLPPEEEEEMTGRTPPSPSPSVG